MKRGGQVVTRPDSGSRGQGSSPGRVICVVFLGKTLHSTQEYKLVPANCQRNLKKCWGVTWD